MPPSRKQQKRGQATRAALLRAALQLFAERGFAGTTVGDIEAEAGLTPRAGGFYRHFESKEQVLEAAFARHVEGLGEVGRLADVGPPGGLRTKLELGGRWALRFLRDQGALLLILMRDGHTFPELQQRVHGQLVDAGYAQAREFFRRLFQEHGRGGADLQALVALAVGSIVHFVEDELRFGIPPAGVSEERFLAGWVETWTRFIEAQESVDSPVDRRRHRSGRPRQP